MKLYYDKPESLSAAISGERRGIWMIDDFISRQAVLDLSTYAPIAPICVGSSIVWRHIIFTSDVKYLPPADVQPIKFGKWIEDGCITKCNQCGEKKRFPHWSFCPNCGADMRGGKLNE